MSLLRPLFLIVILTALIILAAPVGTRPAGAQQLDWAILGCEVLEGPGPDSLTLNLTLALLESPPADQLEVPVTILFNGAPLEPPHVLFAVPGAPGPCPQLPGCPNPVPACAVTGYGYKGVVWTDEWDCLFNFGTGVCDCVPPGMPVPHPKTIVKPPSPPIPSFFDVWVDIDLLIPETNENNNHCRALYNPPTATRKESWGSVKSLYR